MFLSRPRLDKDLLIHSHIAAGITARILHTQITTQTHKAVDPGTWHHLSRPSLSQAPENQKPRVHSTG